MRPPDLDSNQEEEAMISHLLAQQPGPVTARVIARCMESVKTVESNPGVEPAWHFQIVKLADATGKIEAKIWKKPIVTAGQDIQFTPTSTGNGLAIEDGQYGRKLIVQQAATVGPYVGVAGAHRQIHA